MPAVWRSGSRSGEPDPAATRRRPLSPSSADRARWRTWRSARPPAPTVPWRAALGTFSRAGDHAACSPPSSGSSRPPGSESRVIEVESMAPFVPRRIWAAGRCRKKNKICDGHCVTVQGAEPVEIAPWTARGVQVVFVVEQIFLTKNSLIVVGLDAPREYRYVGAVGGLVMFEMPGCCASALNVTARAACCAAERDAAVNLQRLRSRAVILHDRSLPDVEADRAPDVSVGVHPGARIVETDV